jgi:hypothetical protein
VLKFHFGQMMLNTLQLDYVMKLKTRSILQELNEIADRRNTDAVIENRATNIINSAINLLESIHKHYDPEEALELERRLVNSIKGSDPSKFTRGMKKVVESKNKRVSKNNEQ